MKTFDAHFTPVEIDIVRSLVGATWNHFGGSTFVHDGKYALGEVHIDSSVGIFSIKSELVSCPMPTGPEDVARLSISRGSTDIARSKTRGTNYFHEMGLRVEGVSVVRTDVEFRESGERTFRISMDHGIIFRFADHELSIARGGWFIEALDVRRSTTGTGLTIEDRRVDWDSDLMTQYDVTHELIEIR